MMRTRVIEMDVVESTESIKSEDLAVDRARSVEESEDELARRTLLASVVGGDAIEDRMTIDAIPTAEDHYCFPLDEADAYKRDVVTRPDSVCIIHSHHV